MAQASTSLGKRKERDEELVESKPHGSTVFASNLPYTATSTDLSTLFSDIGPVRTAFVVLDKASGSSKGVGYVSFAIREDAQLAYDRANGGEPIVLDGRKLRVQWADSKHHKEQQDAAVASVKKEATPGNINKATQPVGPKDPLAIRTIVISGLPLLNDSKALWKKVRKYEGAEKVEWPVQKDGVEDKNTAYVIFSSPAAAQEAVSKLHAHVFKGALLSVTLKKRLDGLAKPKPTKAFKKASNDTKPSSLPGAAPSRASRLIVRNIPFNITEQDLRSIFLPYGPIYSVHIPLEAKSESSVNVSTSKEKKPRTRGYAFVWMLSKKDAENAIEGANGMKVSAGIAESLIRDKQKKKKLIREERKIKERKKARRERQAEDRDGAPDEDEEKGESENEEKEEEEEAFGPSSQRVIAVDWALSKDRWEEAKARMQEDEGVEASHGDESSDAHGSDSGSEVASDEEDSHIGVHEGESDSDDSEGEVEDEMDVDEEEEKPRKPQLPDVDIGTTLFVRNIPFEATEDDLRRTFRAFGPLRYARITMDHELGRSKGTGFVCFWNKEDADKAVEQSDILRRETSGGEAPGPKKNPFSMPSLLTPDPSASLARNLVLDGRTLDVVRAVTRDEAGKLKEAGERQREKADKRNIYLLREGIILPNMPAASTLSPAELESRTQSFNARRVLLRSNPSLYVSRTRLSIRQLPLFATERMLKRLGIHAVRAFKAEVKAGTRDGLTEHELSEPVAKEDAEAEDGKDKSKAKGKAKFKGRNTGVKQAKIVRQQDRVDPVTGKGRSRGYGFLEMHKHADALRVLRWANNNPAVGKLLAEWWKDELDDLVKIEKKKEKKDEARLERLKKELDELKEDDAKKLKGRRGALIVEFSIENVQVVKRRTEKQEQKTDSFKTKNPRSSSVPLKKEEKKEEALPPKKKRRLSESAPKQKVEPKRKVNPESSEKAGAKLGSMIGRKRKEKKQKKRSS